MQLWWSFILVQFPVLKHCDCHFSCAEGHLHYLLTVTLVFQWTSMMTVWCCWCCFTGSSQCFHPALVSGAYWQHLSIRLWSSVAYFDVSFSMRPCFDHLTRFLVRWVYPSLSAPIANSCSIMWRSDSLLTGMHTHAHPCPSTLHTHSHSPVDVPSFTKMWPFLPSIPTVNGQSSWQSVMCLLFSFDVCPSLKTVLLFVGHWMSYPLEWS